MSGAWAWIQTFEMSGEYPNVRGLGLGLSLGLDSDISKVRGMSGAWAWA